MSKILMVKGNTETYVDELLVEEMEEKGFEVFEDKPVEAPKEPKEPKEKEKESKEPKEKEK